ncbi:cell division protein ZapB [Desulfobulbus sp. US1]|nr:cell division protein ZapB [Desulfobulbus sp. US4]MCW5204968.1 cell division protein ZapB [Desulfobulbus sp. N2]MCW5208806.1 cell division protein ZapB [Desulfobulbus sp. US1]MCW5213825.1 cell division protein ZapB [Desulfobulbus sp. US5]
MDNEEFVRLEQLVETLIDNYSGLKDKYRVLEEKLRESEDERELVKMELAELQEQRSEVGRRVSGLLGRIEQWESEHVGEHTEVGQGEEETDELSGSDVPVSY